MGTGGSRLFLDATMTRLLIVLALCVAVSFSFDEDAWRSKALAYRAEAVTPFEDPVSGAYHVDATPSGTYKGTKSVLGEHIDASITIDSTTKFDFSVQVPGISINVNCKAEDYSLDASSGAVTVPGASKSGDCIHDALSKNSASLKSVSYDSSGDKISVAVKVPLIGSLTIVLNKGGDLMDASGACSNDADQAAWKSHKATFEDDMSACGKKCLGAKSCVTSCIQGKDSYSSGCSSCFGDMAQCTKDNCMLKCINGNSPACKTCVQKSGCVSKFTACSGISDVPTAVDEWPSWVDATPSGTYKGSKSVLGEHVDASITIDSTSTIDLTVTGAISVGCKGEAYSYDASSGK